MQRKNRGGEEGGGDSWMNTYADMVTLLLTFFAVLLSMSTVNQEKFNAFIRSFSNLPPDVIEEIIISGENPDEDPDATQPTPDEVMAAMNDLYQKLSAYIEEHNMQQQISIQMVKDVIFIRFDSAIFFEPDDYTLLSGSDETLSFIGDGINEYEEMIKLVSVCGHTATVSEDYPVSEWMLSCQRAAVVTMYLDEQKHFNSDKLISIGYGNNLPVAENETEEGRKKNRRVEMAIIGLNSNFSFDPYTGLSDLYEQAENITPPAQYPENPDEAGEVELVTPKPGSTLIDTPADVPDNSSVPDDVQIGVSPYE